MIMDFIFLNPFESISNNFNPQFSLNFFLTILLRIILLIKIVSFTFEIVYSQVNLPVSIGGIPWMVHSYTHAAINFTNKYSLSITYTRTNIITKILFMSKETDFSLSE